MIAKATACFVLNFMLVTSLSAGESYTWRNVCIKGNGFIDGIVFSPARPNLLFVHTDMGGAYRWDDGEKRFNPLNDFSSNNDPALNSLGVETLAVDPTDARKVYMACGTYMSPTAVMRSNDCGQTWQRTDLAVQSNGNGSARNAGERLQVDPNSPNILLYGTRVDGLWKSSDSGATWNRVNTFPTTGESGGVARNNGIVWLVVDASSGRRGSPTPVIYAGVIVVSEGVPRIYRSSDAGMTWLPLGGDQPTSAGTFPQRAALTPDGKTLYLTYSSSRRSAGPSDLSNGIVRKVSEPASTSPKWKDVSPKVNYGICAVALDPTDANTVYVGEINDYNPADRIWRSHDAGETWTVMNPNAHRDDSSAPYAKGSKVHWLGDLEIDPHHRDVAIFTTGYGLYRTGDLSSDEPTWAFFNDGLEQTAVLELASPNRGDVHLFSAIGDRDGFRHADFDVAPQEGVLGQSNNLAEGTSDDIVVAWNDANQLVRVVRKSPFVQYSTDNGRNWQWMSGKNLSGFQGRGAANAALTADGIKCVFQPAGDGKLCYATRKGETWSDWTESVGQLPRHCILTSDDVEPQTVYAYGGSTVCKSTDGGAHFEVVAQDAPVGPKWVRAIPGHAGHLVMSLLQGQQGAYRSIDGGTHWTRMNPKALTDVIAVGVGAASTPLQYPSIYVAGTASGLTGFFRSDDQGENWVRINDDAHQFGHITVIQGDPRVYGRLYVGANGRGVIVGDKQ